MTQLWNIDWLNANAERKFPLHSDATGLDVTGTFRLPDAAITDLVLTVPYAVDTDVDKYHLLQIGLSASGLLVVIGYDGQPAMRVFAPRSTHVKNTSYTFNSVAAGYGFDDAQGSITVGDLTSLDDMPYGVFTFDASGGRLEPTVIHPDIRGVTSFRILNGGVLGRAVYGEVVLVAGDNVQLTSSTYDGGGGVAVSQIGISVSEGANITDDAPCADPRLSRPAVRTINGVPPDANGEIGLETTGCATVDNQPGESKIVIDDTCAKPCCGCDELARVIADIKAVNERVVGLQREITAAQSAVQNAVATLLAWKTSGGSAC